MTSAEVRGVAALKRALSTHDPAALDEAVTLLRAAGQDPSVLANLGVALRTRHRWAPHAGDLDAAVDVLGRAVAATPPGDAAAAGRLGNWGLALGDRYEAAGVEDDLHASVDALERAVAAAGGDAEQAARQCGNLAGALLERHRASRDPADLDRAIDLARSAARTAATTADRDSACGNLAAALHDRFRRDGARDDLEDAISAALPDADHRLGPRGLGILGVLLHARFQLTGAADDLGQAITVLTRAEEVTRPGPGATVGGDRAQVFGALGSALLSRFLWRGEAADLDAAITWHRAAAAAASAVDRAMRLSNLGTALASRPGHEPRAADELREALEHHDEAVALAGPAHPDRAAILANRAGALLAAAEVLGLDTTAAAVEGYREAAELAASHPQAQAGYLADEAVAVRVRAVNTGDAAAAREAVRLLRDALALAGPEHRDHPVFCSWLGSALVGRYVRHGAVGDLEEALDWHERAVAGLRPGRVGAARWFAARAYARRLHAQLTGRAEDMSAAVAAFGAALEAEPEARRLPDVLAGLGSALDLRGDTVADLDAAIEARTEAVRLAAGHDRYRGTWLSDLANSLRRRGELLGDAGSADLAESHRLHREAVEVTPSDHPEYATVLSNLAGSHRDRYVRTGAQADLDAALDLLRRAAATVTAPALPRFVAAETGGRLAADTGRWTDAAAAYATAIDLLPAAAWRGGDRAGRERPLRDARWLAAEAVAAALEQDDPAGAVDLLERGRTVLWNQRTETGADLAALRDVAPELADRLDAARAVLDGEPDPDRTTDARIAAAAAWDTAWTQLRGRPELAGLLAPPPWSATPEGTIAAVVVSRYRRDALLVGDGVRALPLTRLDLDELADRLGDYYRALGEVIDPVDQAERRAGERRLTALLAWLGESVVDPVLDAVTAGARLWWCPTGPFAALPLHAAGSAPERVVASYTPSLAALRRAQAATDRLTDGVLGVTAAHAEGGLPLPGTLRELDALAAALPGGVAFTRLDDATRAAVATGLADCAWAHLACHAEQDLAQPSRAAFLLTDGRLRLTEITRAPGRPAAGAYLSACQSAMGGVDLADEALNLAAAMQHAGYRRVVATLWPVGDRLARVAAARVYRDLCADGEFRPDRSAAAVHDLMLELRCAHPDAPSRWAPFVHLGP